MANKLYEETHIQDMADAIREKTGKTDTMLLSQMASEIRGIQVGAGGGSSNGIGVSVSSSFSIPTYEDRSVQTTSTVSASYTFSTELTE